MGWSINKAVAPSNWTKFSRWVKTACNLPPNVTAEEAYKSLGYVRKPTQTEAEKQ